MKAKRRQGAFLLSAALIAGLLCGVAIAGNPHGTPPGQAKQDSSTASTTTTTTTSDNSTGVKPSSTTAHNTHAPAGSNQTKQYGNGKTAGQIAEQNGASSDTDLYGPGNSQPHKVLVCPKHGKAHYVDVHALKSHAGTCPTGGSPGSPSSPNTAGSNVAGANSSASGVSPASSTASGTSPSTSTGVLGASHTSGSKPVAGHARPAHAVLGTASFTG